MILTGTFQVMDWQEEVISQSSESEKLTSARVKQTYQGSIEGSSEVNLQLHYLKSGQVYFNGFERIFGTIDGKQCQFVLHHSGQLCDAVAKSTFEVIDDANVNKQFLGCKGRYSADAGGQANYMFDKK